MTSARTSCAGLGVTLALLLGACGSPPVMVDASLGDDATMDAAPSCRDDDDCDDGLACDGIETCSGGRCVAGEPLDCDDGVACTADACSEELRRCVNRPVDADSDGYPDLACLDGRGAPLGDDCDDAAAGVHPGAVELCDAMGVDEDCDPATRGGRDGDVDGHEDVACCNGTGPGACGTDCNDAVTSANPDASEVCNGIDDDCDGMIDEGVRIAVYRDADGDGRGDSTMSMMACGSTPGYSEHDDDCDDTTAARSPRLPEICDGVDNDCDGTPDPADVPVSATWYLDGDGDGFGDSAISIEACAPPTGYSLLDTDCDDTTSARHPAQPEQCNGIDDDCNGAADFPIGPGNLEDDDGDGRADAGCDPMGPDCDDRDASTAGSSTEVCDGRDNDCDGRTDEGVTSTPVFRDEDGDGWGSSAGGVVVGCGAVSGYSSRDGDCEDRSPLRHPGALEGCNGIDEDCDSRVDEDPTASLCTPVGGATYTCTAGRCRRAVSCPAGFADCDGLSGNGCEADLANDGANCGVCGRRCGSEPNARGVCSASRCAPLACTSGFLDCDRDLGRGGNGCEHPASCGACGTSGARETCGNGVDDNCDGRIDEGCCTAGVSCTTSCGSRGTLTCLPGGTTRCDAPMESCNGSDDDCDGLNDEGCCVAGGSCMTTCGSTGVRSCLPGMVPGPCSPPSETCNGRDDDCDGLIDDGFGTTSCGLGACRRTAAACVGGMPGSCTPGTASMEICNAIDDDCNGTIDDGLGAPITCGVGACQRTVPGCPVGGMMAMCTPGMPGTETCNGLDDDCDGTVDEGLGTLSCGVGACQRTVSACVMGVAQTCTAGMPGTETCNGIDDDCDMTIDDGLGTSSCGVGSCARPVAACVGGAPQVCTPGMPGVESCNGMDDDCDMLVDDGLPPATCGVGACFRSVASCVGGAPQSCAPGAPSMEYCNGVDDDCNGTLDNGCPATASRGAASNGPTFSGGAVFTVDCLPGEALVGIQGRNGSLIDQLQPICAQVQIGVSTLTMPDYTYTVQTGVPSPAGTVGGAGGGPFGPDFCPPNQVVVGIRGGAGDDVDWIELQCGTVAFVRTAGFGVVITPTSTTTARGGVGGGAPFSDDCPAGQVTVGFVGEAGALLNAIGQRCAPITFTTL